MNLKEILILSFLSLCDLFGGSIANYADSKYSNLKLIVDHDGGADDAMAVIMCILHEKYFNGMEVVALTTTYGNVNESQVFINSQRFLDMTGRRDLPIYRGATQSLIKSIESDFFFGYDGLGDNGNYTEFKPISAQDLHAANALIDFSKKYEGELVVMTIGPLTNVALAQRLDPEFINRLAHLYVGAGHIHNAEHREPEFNAHMDVEAYRIVADSARSDKVTFIPFSQIRASLNLTKEWRINVLGAINTQIMKDLLSFERLSLAATKRWTLLDPSVAAIVLNQSLVEEFKTANHNIIVCGSDRGINTNIIDTKNANIRLVYSVNRESYQKFLIDIFSAELNVCIEKNK